MESAGWQLSDGTGASCLVALFSHVDSVWPHAGSGDSDANNLAQVSCP